MYIEYSDLGGCIFFIWGRSSNLIGSVRGLMRLLRNFHLILFSVNQLRHDNFGLWGVFLASNSLHDLWGQKYYAYLDIWPCLLFFAHHLGLISSIFDKCLDTLTMRFTVKPYILWKGLFNGNCSKFYKLKYGHNFFLTSNLMKAGRGQKHLSEAKKGMKELIYWKKYLMKVSQQPQKFLSGSNHIWAMTSGKKDTATSEVAV